MDLNDIGRCVYDEIQSLEKTFRKLENIIGAHIVGLDKMQANDTKLDNAHRKMQEMVEEFQTITDYARLQFGIVDGGQESIDAYAVPTLEPTFQKYDDDDFEDIDFGSYRNQ